MQRRDFLAVCTAPALAAGSTAGVLGSPLRTDDLTSFPLPPPPDMDAYLARVDAGLERIGAGALGASGGDPLARGSLQALFLRGMLGDLPLEQQLHPGMQDRIWRAMPLFDEVTAGVSCQLGSTPASEFQEVQSRLRTPGAPEQLIATLDSEAALTGVSAPRRAQARRLLEQVTWRLANQPPALIVGEYLRKVEKVAASDILGSARRQRLAARIGEKTFWGVAREAPAAGSAGLHSWTGGRVLGIDTIQRSSGVAVAASAGDVVAGVLVIGATVGVVVLLVYLVKALIGSGKEKTAPPNDPKKDPVTKGPTGDGAESSPP